MATPQTHPRNTNDPKTQTQRAGQSGKQNNHADDNGANPRSDSSTNNRTQDRAHNGTDQSAKTSGPQQRKDRDAQDASAGKKLSTEDKLGQDETNMGEQDVPEGSRRAQGRAQSSDKSHTAAAGIDDEDVDIDEPIQREASQRDHAERNTKDKAGKSGKSGDCGCG